MDITRHLPLLGGLTPQVFMRRHWQKKPLLIRQAVSLEQPFIDRSALFELAAREGVESRLITRSARAWKLRHGPIARRALPALGKPDWTLLVQGVDLHLDAAHELLSRFRFAPDARLDDLMVSWASDGGGVGPHVDSYDVFLLQLQGRRRWRIGRLADPQFEADVPLKILSNFVAEEEWLLDPGDMLYLPPRWAHDGVAEGECITASIGFRSAPRSVLARELLQCMLDGEAAPELDPLYRDPGQLATAEPARVPAALAGFAADAVARALRDPTALACALGELLSEPKPGVWFDPGRPLVPGRSLRLDRRTRMLYDERHVFINGVSFRAGGRDARLMRQLADERRLEARDLRRLSAGALELVAQWSADGWLHADTVGD